MGDIILTRPEHDLVTKYLSNWTPDVKESAVQRSWNVTDLDVEQVTRTNVEGRLSNNEYELIFLNGHGDPHAVRGHDDEIIIEEHDNHELLANSIVHCVSCNVGRSLAQTAVNDGTRAFLAYRNDFGSLTHKHSESSP